MSNNCLIRHMRAECECGDTCAIQDMIDDEVAVLKAENMRLKRVIYLYIDPDRLPVDDYNYVSRVVLSSRDEIDAWQAEAHK